MDEKDVPVGVPVQQQPTTAMVVYPKVGPQQPGLDQPAEKCCGCCPALPANASSDVKNTRRASIAILIIHIVCMIGLFGQYVGNAIGIVTSIFVLCKLTRRVYLTAAILYMLGFISDLFFVFVWIVFYGLVKSLGDEDDPPNDSEPIYAIIFIWIVPTALGALSFLVGAVFAGKAVRNWQHSGAADSILLV